MDFIARGTAQRNAGAVPARRRTKKIITRELTKGEITAQAIKIMSLGGWICWPQSNVRTVGGRTFKGRKGVSDILGFNKLTGLFMACEVKTVLDRLRPEQIIFLTEVTQAGGLAIIAHQDEQGKVLLTEFKNYHK